MAEGAPDAHRAARGATEDDDTAGRTPDESSDADFKVDGRPAKRMRLEPAEANGECCPQRINCSQLSGTGSATRRSSCTTHANWPCRSTGNHADGGELDEAPEEPMPDFSTLDGGPEHHKVAVPVTAVGERFLIPRPWPLTLSSPAPPL